MKFYVASSWRNELQPDVVRRLVEDGHEVYDFRDPHDDGSDRGFHWSDIDPEWKSWSPEKFIHALNHRIAVKGFRKDWEAMQWAEACVLVMPCGRSAHLEAGYFVGAGKRLFIITSDGEPELMYGMADRIFAGVDPFFVSLPHTLRLWEEQRIEELDGAVP